MALGTMGPMAHRISPSDSWEDVETLLQNLCSLPFLGGACSSAIEQDTHRIPKTASLRNDMRAAVPQIDLDYMGTLHPSVPEHCARLSRYVWHVMRANPHTARYCYVFDDYFHESLLYRVLCYKPPLDLVKYIHEAYPEAMKEQNPYHKTPLHRACHFRASAEVIEYLIKQDPKALQVQPNPLFLAIHPETSPEVIELLAKSYPEALTLPGDGMYTPLDYALIERLPSSIFQSLLKHYPSRMLKVATMQGGAPVGGNITCLLSTTMEHVRVLNVSKIRLSAYGLYKLLEGVYTNRALEELILDVTGVGITPLICETMELMLKSSTTVLKKLAFRNGIPNPKFVTALAEGMRSNTSIEELTVEGSIAAESASELVEALAENTSLKRLILTGNEVGEEGSGCWDSVALLTNLEALSLSNCQAGPSLAIPLAILISTSAKLTALNFKMNSIGDEGVAKIANALIGNSSVQWMDMRGNEVGILAEKALVESLQNCNYTLSCIKVEDQEDEESSKVLDRVMYLCQLNDAGRSTISGAPKAQFVDLLNKHTENNVSVLYGLLRHLPHIWSGVD